MNTDFAADIFGVKIVESDLMPKGKAALIGRNETVFKSSEKDQLNWWATGEVCVGMIDLDKGEMTMFKDSTIIEIRTTTEGVEMLLTFIRERQIPEKGLRS